jgi:hypothetical protein
MHPVLNTMLTTEKIADLHRDAAQARLVHELRKEHPTTRRAGWTARVAAYLTLTATRTPTRFNA